MTTTTKGDLQILLQMLRGRSRNGSHKQQLEDFYATQAENYDAFRERLLHGRRELIEQMEIVPAHVVVELGAGTGLNLRYLEHPLPSYRRIDIVDLCTSLLAVARNRYLQMANINIIEADAASYCPDTPVDRVYFSYALTMIPDWKKAVDNAIAMLKPGGLIGVVDFYISGAGPGSGSHRAQHGCISRRFWQAWFAHDGVHLTPEHLQYLRTVTDTICLEESHGKVPYLPFMQAPYYIYVGQKS